MGGACGRTPSSYGHRIMAERFIWAVEPTRGHSEVGISITGRVAFAHPHCLAEASCRPICVGRSWNSLYILRTGTAHSAIWRVSNPLTRMPEAMIHHYRRL